MLEFNPYDTVLYSVFQHYFRRFWYKSAKTRYLIWNIFLSVRLSLSRFVWENSALNRRIFMKFDIWLFFEKKFGTIQVGINSYMNNWYFNPFDA